MKRMITILALALVVFYLPAISAGKTAQIDTVTIYQLQHVTDPAVDDTSPLLGDTIVVRGMVMHSPRELYVGARWATYIIDPDSFPNPWSGFFIIQDDTTQGINTLFGLVEPGMVCSFTGVVSEYNGLSQINLYSSSFKPDPIIPVTIESAGNPLPEPLLLTTLDFQDRAAGEKWEAMWVQFNNASIINNAVSGNRASFTDISGGLTYLDDYFNWFRDRIVAGSYKWPPSGTLINAKGFVRHTAVNEYSINPRNDDDLEKLTTPPVIETVLRSPGVPTTRGDVIIKTKITDNSVVSKAVLNYSVNEAAFQQVDMTVTTADTFTAKIPAQSDGAFVRYFIYAEDDAASGTKMPADTSRSVYFYVLRKNGLTIKDLQYTWEYPSDASGYMGYEVTVKGVVTTDKTNFPNSYYIEDQEAAWSGMWIRDLYHKDFAIGDQVQITGKVYESYGVTNISVTDSANGATLLGSGNAIAPVKMTTGELTTAGAYGEVYESVLVRLENLNVTNTFPDGAYNYGEFAVNDGTGEIRVDDNNTDSRRATFNGNYDTTYVKGGHIEAMIAIHGYSHGNYKLLPRGYDDIINYTAIGNEPASTVNEFCLDQNYPNPFNPNTTIQFRIARSGNYTLTVYNVLGQRLATLLNSNLAPGSHRAEWNGRDVNGKAVGSGIYFYILEGNGVRLSHKMILLK
jgi:hypothetical protein